MSDERTPARAAALQALTVAVAALEPRLMVRINRNRRVLLSVRWQDRRSGTLSVHAALLDDAVALAEIPRWIRQGGSTARFPGITAALRRVGGLLEERERLRAPSLGDLVPLGGPLPLATLFDRIHATWFPHLSKPAVGWARDAWRPGQRQIRFGCYHRSPEPRVTLHPRLDQPWVALVFVEHVLFHELCHHAQASRPVRGEGMHSPRFRAWERRYPHHEQALAWERAHLRHLLEGTVPDGHGRVAAADGADASSGDR